MIIIARKRGLLLVILAVALSAVILSSTLASAAFAVTKKLPIYSVGRDDKKIAISFDCAWGTEHTQTILDNLAFYSVRATFFMVEFFAEKNTTEVEKIHISGHEIGTHSATHSYMSKMSKEDIEKELISSSLAIAAITGKSVTLFRPPYGDYDDLLIETCDSLGIYPIQWDVDSLDWKGVTALEIAERVISRVKSGSIILCHNNGEHTAEALPIIFTALLNKGYKFVPIGELIYEKDYYIDNSGRQFLIKNN